MVCFDCAKLNDVRLGKILPGNNASDNIRVSYLAVGANGAAPHAVVTPSDWAYVYTLLVREHCS